MGSDNLYKFEMQPGYSTAIYFKSCRSYKLNQFVLLIFEEL